MAWIRTDNGMEWKTTRFERWRDYLLPAPALPGDLLCVAAAFGLLAWLLQAWAMTYVAHQSKNFP